MVAKVDINKCIGCCRCELACPEEAISVERKAEIDEEKCRGCGSCTVVCERQAVILVEG